MKIEAVAQSFSFDEDLFITGIDLYFRNISSEDGAYCWVSIKEVFGGYPIGSQLYYKELLKSEIASYVSLDASTAYHIEFDYPILCKTNQEYAFCIGSNKNGFKLWYAQMGNRDITTNEQITYQPNPRGVMFMSSNNSTWTAIQDSDIKYILYRAVFETEADFYIPSVRPTDGDYSGSIGNYHLSNITLPNVIFDDTEVNTYYKINSSDIYTETALNILSLEEKMEHDLTSEYISDGMEMGVKISLTSDNDKVSPIINTNKAEAFLAKYKNIGSYIQHTFNVD